MNDERIYERLDAIERKLDKVLEMLSPVHSHAEWVDGLRALARPGTPLGPNRRPWLPTSAGFPTRRSVRPSLGKPVTVGLYAGSFWVFSFLFL